MIFPNINSHLAEKQKFEEIGNGLANIISDVICTYCGIRTQVRISGSTEKLTALPEELFGLDIDVAILADKKLINAITFPSYEFEGCQIFSIKFFSFFNNSIPNLYYAGHRISGIFKGIKFDCTISDLNKDIWKWDYNDSKYLPKENTFLQEVKKLKYISKIFNYSGSEVQGLVGPAAELAIYENRNVNKVLEIISGMQKLQECPASSLRSQLFPKDYYKLFGKPDDYIKVGLINSFRLTTPNVFNRMIRTARLKPESIEEYIRFQNPKKIFSVSSKTNIRLLNLILLIYTQNANNLVDIVQDKKNYFILTSNKDEKLINNAIKDIILIESVRYFDFDNLSSSVKRFIQGLLPNFDILKYSFFVGVPSGSPDQIPIPFDFLVRPNAKDLITLMIRNHDSK